MSSSGSLRKRTALAQPHAAALSVLQKDPRFAALIRKHGPPQLSRKGALFRALCRAIISQQVSTKAAASIFKKFRQLVPGKPFPTPRDILALSPEQLRSAGLPPQKQKYILDLALKCTDGTIRPQRLARMTNDEVIAYLTQVHGIGAWTVQMLLIFTLGRPDVLPTGDLGIQNGFMHAYGLKTRPTHEQMERLAKEWRAHASVASWYLWRAAGDATAKK